MHSITDRRTDRRTDGQQAAANSRSYCVAVRSAKNEGEESNMCYTCSALQSGHDEFTHARSRWGQCVGCAKIAGSMRKQFVPLRVHCGHVRALRELCVTDAVHSARTGRRHRFTLRSIPLKWHALPRHTVCHCGNKSRASVSAPLHADSVTHRFR